MTIYVDRLSGVGRGKLDYNFEFEYHTTTLSLERGIQNNNMMLNGVVLGFRELGWCDFCDPLTDFDRKIEF